MSGDPFEQTATALSPREEWRLVCWMVQHPRALLEDTTTGHLTARPAHASRRAPLAYALGLAVGTVWLLLRRWW